MLDILVTEIVLQRPRVLAVIGQLEARAWRSMCG
jgi:hypothetical protein